VSAEATRPERGRLSSPSGSSVLECGSVSGGEVKSVPAAQVTLTITPQTHSLMPFLDTRYLAHALRQCGRRRSSPGADGMTWAGYRRAAFVRIPRLAAALRDGSWRPGPLRSSPFLTYSGKELPCVISTVEDRIVHRAMRNAVEPILEAHVLADWVAGYRPRRNRITALRHAMVHIDAGYGCVADLDVEKVSQGSDAREATDWLAAHIHDGVFLDRFRIALTGLPSPLAPGAGLSPLLINLRLSRSDRLLDGLRVVRFADNYCAFTATSQQAEGALERIRLALAEIQLVPNAAKTRIREGICVEDLFLLDG
jgi:RNA-directed DNA polymerase